VSLGIEALKRLNAALLADLEEREELRRQVRVARETLADFAAVDRERMALQQRVRLLEAALRRWHRPIAPSGRPCVCAGCEAIAALATALAVSRETPPPCRVLDPQDAWPLYREGGRRHGLG
jgi:hypothetical protein